MPEETKVSVSKAMKLLDFFRAVADDQKRIAVAREKMELEQTKFLVQEHRKKREYAMTNMAKYMDGLEEGPSKDLARARFKGYFNSLPKFEQEILTPHFQTLYSPVEEKLMEFEKLYGKPIDPAVVDPSTDPVTRAKLQFANEDYQGMKKQFIGGITYKPNNTSYINENQWAWRNKEGKMGILSREGSANQEWVKKTLDKANMSWDMAMAQDGVVPTDVPRRVTDGRTQYEITPLININTQQRSHRKIPMGRILRPGERKLPQVISDFSTSFTLGDGVGVWEGLKGGAPEGAALYDELQNRLDALEEVPIKKVMTPVAQLGPENRARLIKSMIREILGTHMTGWNVEVHDPGKFKEGAFFGIIPYTRFAESKTAGIYFIPGVVQPFFNAKQELVGRYYWDEDYDIVRDAFNRVKGTKAEMDVRAVNKEAGAWLPEEEK